MSASAPEHALRNTGSQDGSVSFMAQASARQRPRRLPESARNAILAIRSLPPRRLAALRELFRFLAEALEEAVPAEIAQGLLPAFAAHPRAELGVVGEARHPLSHLLRAVHQEPVLAVYYGLARPALVHRYAGLGRGHPLERDEAEVLLYRGVEDGMAAGVQVFEALVAHIRLYLDGLGAHRLEHGEVARMLGPVREAAGYDELPARVPG